MTYLQRHLLVEQQVASHKAEQLMQTYARLSLRLDPIHWQEDGMQAIVAINGIEITSLLQLSQRSDDDLLRQAQIKLFAHAALEAAHARAGLKVLVWSPVDVIQPQPFVSLWIITLETNERIPIVESIRNEERIYEHYRFDKQDGQQLAQLFGPLREGEYHRGDLVTIKERENQYSGEILYVLSPGKLVTNRKPTSRGFQTIAGTSSNNQMAARYLVDCNDGFPHLVNQ